MYSLLINVLVNFSMMSFLVFLENVPNIKLPQFGNRRNNKRFAGIVLLYLTFLSGLHPTNLPPLLTPVCSCHKTRSVLLLSLYFPTCHFFPVHLHCIDAESQTLWAAFTLWFVTISLLQCWSFKIKTTGEVLTTVLLKDFLFFTQMDKLYLHPWLWNYCSCIKPELNEHIWIQRTIVCWCLAIAAE